MLILRGGQMLLHIFVELMARPDLVALVMR